MAKYMGPTKYEVDMVKLYDVLKAEEKERLKLRPSKVKSPWKLIEEEKKPVEPKAQAYIKRGILWPPWNEPESELFSIRNTECGRWTNTRKNEPIKIPQWAEICNEIIKRTYVRDKFVKEFFDKFDSEERGWFELTKS